jgi:hypothetical protein
LAPDAAIAVDGDRLLLSVGQSERSLPLAAARWIHDTITQGFWRDFPPDRFAESITLAGERLELRRGWGFGGPDQRGFTLTNFDRLTPSGYPQEVALSDVLLLQTDFLQRLVLVAR